MLQYNEMIIVMCPKCFKKQKYLPQKGLLSEKSKRCVYCGHTFKIYINPYKNRILKIEKN
ncbi:MAG: hypothetical protein QXL18_01670 [Candidatus Woesearchaeota archaeon]